MPLHLVEGLKVLEFIRAGCWEEMLGENQRTEEDPEIMVEQEATRMCLPPTQHLHWQKLSSVTI